MKTSSVQGSPRCSNQRMLAAVDLDQLTITLAPKTRLMEASALLA
jgi:hypothetical protein